MANYTERRLALDALFGARRGAVSRASRETGIPASIISGIRTGRTVNEAKLTQLEEWAATALTPAPQAAPEHLQHPVIAL